MFAGLYDNDDPNAVLLDDCADGLKQFTQNCDKYTDPDEYKKIISPRIKEQWQKFMDTPQPSWIKDNAYSGFATPSVHEKNAFVAKGLTLELTEVDDIWELEINVPGEFASASCESVTTKRLGEPRIAAMAFEAPDGSELDFGRDITGNVHTDSLIPGPFAILKAGTQKIKVWKNNF